MITPVTPPVNAGIAVALEVIWLHSQAVRCKIILHIILWEENSSHDLENALIKIVFSVFQIQNCI